MSVRDFRALNRRRLGAAGVAALMAACGTALGQPETRPPVDVNNVQPSVGSPSTAAAPMNPADPNTPATVDDGDRYPVSRFVIEYHTEHAEHPSIDELLSARAHLSVAPDGYVAYREGLPDAYVRVGDVSDTMGGMFHRSALNSVAKAIVEKLNERGLIGIFVQLHPEDIDEVTGADLRGGARTELRLLIWTGTVKEIRAISSGERLESQLAGGSRVNPEDPVLNRIRAQSPIQADNLLRKDRMDAYVFGLNRHPGRRVDVAIAPAGEPEEVVVDYLVTEAKPWSAYFQLSNTGTRATNSIRERFGFVHNQLTGRDDVLRLDYITGGFTDAHSVAVNYEFPVLSNRLRIRTFGAFSTFEASDVGLANETFSGETFSLGAEVQGTIYQRRELFVDAVGGLRYQNVHVENTTFATDGRENFVIPYAGLRLERSTEANATFAGLTMEFQIPELAGTDSEEVQNLGRPSVDDSWQLLKFYVEHSFYLEPIFNPTGYAGGESTGAKTLAHEVSASIRGQYSFGQRLIPNEEEVAGGLFSVRGYPESDVAGDDAVIASLEYRFHFPRILPIAEPGYYKWFGDKGAGRQLGWFGDQFRYNPQQEFGRPDWDLVFRAFVDAAHVSANDKQPGEEDDTLVGAGIGIEYSHKRNVNARLDFGVPLRDDSSGDTNAGEDCRLHFSITLLY